LTENLTLDKFEEQNVVVSVSMETEVHDIELKGCSPIPLAHYLKALGIFRLIAEQKDPRVRGYWKNDVFHVRTKLTKEEITKFFLEEYQPSPILAPWGARSGFFSGSSEKSAREALHVIEKTDNIRFNIIKNCIHSVQDLLRDLCIEEKPNDDKKTEFMNACRSYLSDDMLPWIDTTYVLTENGKKFPPLMGTGGNEGSGSYVSGFMQQIVSCLINHDFDDNIDHSLFNEGIKTKNTNQTPGHFFPFASGGVNSSNGFSDKPFLDPWDYLFLIEGTLTYASALTKKGSSNFREISFPFVTHPSPAGYGSASNNDGIKPSSAKRDVFEIWCPLWNAPISYLETKYVFQEGRVSIGKRIANNGIDFIRGISSLGTERGIQSFQRHIFLMRNGQNFIAIPTGRFKVERKPDADLVMEIDLWLDRFRYKCTKEDAPASFSRAMNNLDRSILDICKREGPSIVQNLLTDLGRCEKAMVTGLTWTMKSNLRPVPPLSQKWLEKADDGSVEFRLAASLASVYGKYGKDFIPIRYNIEPVNRSVVDGKMKSVWWVNEGNKHYMKSSGKLAKALNAIMERRLITASQCNVDEYPDHGTVTANTSDIADFIEGRINDQKMIDLLWGLLLIDWNSVSEPRIVKRTREDGILPGADYSIMKLCYHNWYGSDIEIKLNGQIHRNASHGNGMMALELAIRRLRGSGIVPAVDVFSISRSRSERIAASMLFPISTGSALMLKDNVTRPKNNKEE